jgi:tetratricopeptide (TPR) repeat protein
VAARPLSIRRKILFASALTALGVVLLLGLVEGILRLANYGYSSQFTRVTELASGEKIRRENRWCTAPFFTPALVRRPHPFRLEHEKPANTYRIFVLGSSAAMGDPEPSFSLARMLETMLRAAYPEIRFEVVNAAVTAINSHLVRRIAADCAELQPDLFIVYEGHNEVIGPFGPSGVFTPFLRRPAAVRLAAAAKASRTGQLVAAAGRAVARQENVPESWGGMQMFLDQQISADDPRLDAVRTNFRANLLAIADSAHAAGATTLVCTVLTNQRDFAPFLSRHRVGLDEDSLATWEAHYRAAQEAERKGDFARAEADYRAALAIDGDYAELAFRFGRLSLQAGRRSDAQTFLQRALDLDTLRFRADSSLNQVIRDLRSGQRPSLEVVDLASSLSLRSEGGVVGDEFLYEHVHLTFRGAYEAARDLFVHVSSDLARRRLINDRIAEPFSYEEARIRLAYTAHEQAMIALELINRFRSPPFTGQIDHAFRLQSWERRAETATTLLARPEALPALHELYKRALAVSPDDWVLARNAGSMLVSRQAAADAIPLLERAASWIDDDPDTLIALAWAYHALQNKTRADEFFARVRALEPNYPGLPR